MDWGTMVIPLPFHFLAGASCSPQVLQTRQLEGSPRGFTLISNRRSPIKVKPRLEIRDGWPLGREEVSLPESLDLGSKEAEFGHAGVDDDVISLRPRRQPISLEA